MVFCNSTVAGFAVHNDRSVLAVGATEAAAMSIARRNYGWRVRWLRVSPASADLLHDAEQNGAGIPFLVDPDGALVSCRDPEH